MCALPTLSSASWAIPPCVTCPRVICPQFRKLGYEVIDWIADYFSRDLEASRVKPGRCSTERTDGVGCRCAGLNWAPQDSLACDELQAHSIEDLLAPHFHPDVQPGFLAGRLPPTAPEGPERWPAIMQDFKSIIM